MARLYFFLTTPDIHFKVKKHSISHGYRTDHSLLNLEINPFNSKKGKGFWKFNTSLLHDTAYIQLVKHVIETTVCDYSVDKNDSNLGQNQMLFELIKLNIRGHTIAYSTKKVNLTTVFIPVLHICTSGPGFTKGLKFRQFFCLDKS